VLALASQDNSQAAFAPSIRTIADQKRFARCRCCESDAAAQATKFCEPFVTANLPAQFIERKQHFILVLGSFDNAACLRYIGLVNV
jgi:hypothetical protein